MNCSICVHERTSSSKVRSMPTTGFSGREVDMARVDAPRIGLEVVGRCDAGEFGEAGDGCGRGRLMVSMPSRSRMARRRLPQRGLRFGRPCVELDRRVLRRGGGNHLQGVSGTDWVA